MTTHMRTNELEVSEAITYLCILSSLYRENEEWYKSLRANTPVRASSEANYFFSYKSGESTVLGLCLIDDPVVRHTASVLTLQDHVYFGRNGDPVQVLSVDDLFALLNSGNSLEWFGD